MTPRQADIAFVLEGVPGVREVYALERGSAGDLELAVGVGHGGRPVALAHYALLRVLTHEECKTVRQRRDRGDPVRLAAAPKR